MKPPNPTPRRKTFIYSGISLKVSRCLLLCLPDEVAHNNGGGELGQRLRFRFLLSRLSPTELQANLHNRGEFCTGRSDVQCSTQREGKSPVPYLIRNYPPGECRFQTLLRSARSKHRINRLLRLRQVAPTFCGQRWPRSQHFAHGHVLFGDLAKMLEQLQSHSLVFVSTCHSGVCPAPGGNAGGVLRGVKKKISKNTLYVF